MSWPVPIYRRTIGSEAPIYDSYGYEPTPEERDEMEAFFDESDRLTRRIRERDEGDEFGAAERPDRFEQE